MGEESEIPEQNAVRMETSRDPRPLLRGIFLLLGVGVLVPWNAFISAKDYFEGRFCDPNDPDSSSSTMESTFVFVYTLSSVISLAVILLGDWGYDHFVTNKRTIVPSEEVDGIFRDEDSNEEGDEETREVVTTDPDALQQHEPLREPAIPEHTSSMWFDVIPLSLFLLVFIGQTILVLCVQLSSPNSIKFWTYLSLAICGVCTALTNAGIVAVAASFEDTHSAMNPFLTVREFVLL
jgi:hypothetical protein